MRRTSEDLKLIAEKLKVVIEKCKELDISAYDIGQNTNVSASGVKKILNGKTLKPSLETLSIIEDYIKSREGFVAEEKANYQYQKMSINQKIDHIYKKVDEIEDLIRSFDIKQQIMFEILKGAKSEEIKFIETAIKERLSSENKPL